MALPENFVHAVYRDPGSKRYRGNPLIEALTPIMSIEQIKKGLKGKVLFDPGDIYADGRKRAHEVSALLDDFFNQSPTTSNLKREYPS